MTTMGRPHGVAFDLDGTLIDSRLDIVAACKHVLVGAGRTPLAPEVIATFIGDGVRALVAKAFGLPPGAASGVVALIGVSLTASNEGPNAGPKTGVVTRVKRAKAVPKNGPEEIDQST
jgi:phosphoglycolate phosphatase-like HAD superfamily hydrolase